MKKVLSIIIAIVVLLAVLSVIRPYWNKYSLKKDMEAAAIYGTKHKLAQIEKFLDDKNQEADRDIELDSFTIEKDERNSVAISVAYTDYISLFGFRFFSLNFEVEASADEIEEML